MLKGYKFTLVMLIFTNDNILPFWLLLVISISLNQHNTNLNVKKNTMKQTQKAIKMKEKINVYSILSSCSLVLLLLPEDDPGIF